MKLRSDRLCGETSPKEITVEDYYEKLKESMSPMFGRIEAVRYLGGTLYVGRLANLDSLGQGPQGKVTVGRKVAYFRDPFIAWLRSRGEASAKPKMKPSKA